MIEPLPDLPPQLQTASATTAPTAGAAEIAHALLVGDCTLDECVEQVAAHLSASGRADDVAAVLTTFVPADPDRWVPLGERAWIREWRDADSPCVAVPDHAQDAESALSMPWVSQFSRMSVIAIPDRELLPPEADQDRRELARCGVRATMVSTQGADGVMFGSISIASATPGPWPEELMADLSLLSAALSARMQVEQSKRSTAEAISLADQVRGTQQQFFATIGHELRTPVSAILGFAEVMADEAKVESTEEGDFASRVEHDSGVILRAAEQLHDIIEDLLSTGRALGAEDARGDLDLAAAIADVVHWHRTPARAHDVRLVSAVEPGLTVHARASGVRQVLTNLISNAIVHNPPGGTVEISAERSLDEGRDQRVRISVRDSGRGLTADELARVFEPFVRFADRSVKGTGLGLPIARAVAERDGGLVGAESIPGEGSVFWVDLPARAVDPD